MPSTQGGNTPVIGSKQHDQADTAADAPVKTGSIAKSTQQTAVADGDRVNDVANLYGEKVTAGYTWATTSNRTEEIDPISQHYITEELANEENKDNGTYNYFVDMSGYRECGFQLTLTGSITVKLYGTQQDDGTAAASITDWQDICGEWGVASWTASTLIFDSNKMLGQLKFIKVEVTTAGGGSDDYVIRCKKLY